MCFPLTKEYQTFLPNTNVTNLFTIFCVYIFVANILSDIFGRFLGNELKTTIRAHLGHCNIHHCFLSLFFLIKMILSHR